MKYITYTIIFIFVIILLSATLVIYKSVGDSSSKVVKFYCASGECVVNLFTGNKTCDFSQNMTYNPESETCSAATSCTGLAKFAIDSLGNAVSPNCESQINCNCLQRNECNSSIFSDVFVSNANGIVVVPNLNANNEFKCEITQTEFTKNLNSQVNLCSAGGTFSKIKNTSNYACVKQLINCDGIPTFDKNTLKLQC